ncbi:DUF2570 domain-containing protein [Limnobaculum zhutongyuii]|uniref:DUF2570 domain-containing protein n=1 Tax=Limnobaculum zhutongyuii TaxID=2498113 RepID=A0A411WQJ1_9GAMM|nr:DUF2570 domain-containing protein [Limnobaculum zhutongyuii]QBH98426.1 DUF2570 domain-containing protein [Limnobaculum zhutongyuii]TQS89676.1 DUF2570 domain-containing protein [Limnobaculum zhutongyuii]
MSFVNKWITAALGTLCVVMLLLYCRWLSHQLNQLKNEKQQAAVALAEERAYSAKIRTQYLQIQEVMDGVAEQKQASESRAKELQKQLVAAQANSKCFSVPVPDSVTQQLRERAAEINAATTGAK